MIAALVRHERAAQAVAGLKVKIGEVLALCPVQVEIEQAWQGKARQGKANDHLIDQNGRIKTHLWHAFQHREPSSCGWGTVGLSEDGIDDALSPGSEFECEHCLQAWRLIVERKHARQELGIARRLIRHYGKKAMAMQEAAE